MVTKTLVMTFKNEGGKNVNLSLRGIKDTLTDSEIKSAMDTIIAKDLFISSGGKLIEKVDAQIVTKDTTGFVVK